MEAEILNITANDNNPFETLEANRTYTVTFDYSTFEYICLYITYGLELVKLVLILATLIVDVLYTYIILRYKKLKTTYNYYLVSYFVCNLAYFLLSPLLIIFHALFLRGLGGAGAFYYFAVGLDGIFFFGCLFYFFLLGVDWSISNFYPDITNKIKIVCNLKFYIYAGILFLSTIFGYLFCNVTGFSCLSHEFKMSLLPFMFISLLICWYIRSKRTLNKKQLKTEYSLILPIIVYLLHTPLYIIDRISLYAYWSRTAEMELLFYCFDTFIVTTPIIIVRYLNNHNKDFKMAFDSMFKKSVQTYENENLDSESEDEEQVKNSTNNFSPAFETVSVDPIYVP